MHRNYSANLSSLPGRQNCYNFPSHYFDSGDLSTSHYANCVINSLFSLVTIIASLFIIVSVRKIVSLRKPSKLLLGSVFLGEAGIGAIAQPAYATFLFTKATGQEVSPLSCVAAVVTNLSASILGCGCLLTLTAVCMDRYLALFHYARYRTLVTTTRAASLLVFVWLLSIAWGTSWQWCNRCYYPVSIAVLTLALGLTSFCYFKIYVRLKHRQVQIESRTRQTSNPVNLSAYRTSILNLLVIHGSLLLGFTPYLCAVLLFEIRGFTAARLMALEFTTTVMLSRSAFNSVMCCCRIREVRAHLMEILCTCCRSH